MADVRFDPRRRSVDTSEPRVNNGRRHPRRQSRGAGSEQPAKPLLLD
jgi:hypothetical protein